MRGPKLGAKLTRPGSTFGQSGADCLNRCVQVIIVTNPVLATPEFLGMRVFPGYPPPGVEEATA